MRNQSTCIFTLFVMITAIPFVGHALDFFTIQSVKFVAKPPSHGFALYQVVKPDKTNKPNFLPFLEVTVKTRETTKSDTLYAKAYYYDKSRKLIEKTDTPSPGGSKAQQPDPMPFYFTKSKTETIYFAVPENVLETREWQVVVVFGGDQAATASVYPSGRASSFDFPERPQFDKPTQAEREVVMDPVVEHVVKTRNEKQPQITLFMRPPIGMTNLLDAHGVLAMCLLANDASGIKRRLQELETKDDVGSILRFAEKHKLVILCWGSRSLWNPRASWNEQSKQVNKQMDDTFDDVAKAWAKGVEELSHKYGMPDKGFLLWGISGSAQYAARLALRQPQFFLAVHVHIPSSFDQPTQKANSVLWCLTTGENECGYERSLHFLSACQDLGYPIMYKAIPGLGHAGHPVAEQFGLDFFEYALSVREEKPRIDSGMTLTHPWPKSFRTPVFVGDVVNQQIFPFEKIDMVPKAFRTMLPTQILAKTWNLEK